MSFEIVITSVIVMGAVLYVGYLAVCTLQGKMKCGCGKSKCPKVDHVDKSV